MQDGPLDNALETGSGGGVDSLFNLEGIELAVEIEHNGVFQIAQIDTTGIHHLGSVAIVDQCEQKMFQCGILVAAVRGIFQRLMQGLLERFSEGWHIYYSKIGTVLTLRLPKQMLSHPDRALTNCLSFRSWPGP